eukprot:CAMPEP_0175806168 /NCGR_PEP_ID=MMETSP0107_2-20121207/1043_1 /TAXON_ID=195067 ORGANISM="Goniomonas pacifica, Strain CCMP1869" /NCGR_SAMPLE_ID=MMETSP0107_2 /ASSEMBLY_ACC=CAM_ASM_000203 /LENGTH=44 /DNA_ID= /DNA_START= /DNA_END= /DNA_ORIENTATION=
MVVPRVHHEIQQSAMSVQHLPKVLRHAAAQVELGGDQHRPREAT